MARFHSLFENHVNIFTNDFYYEGKHLKTRNHGKLYRKYIPTKIRSISQWFPEKRGLVGSIVIAGSGYGPTVWIPLQTLYVNPDNVAAVEAEGEIDRYASFRLS